MGSFSETFRDNVLDFLLFKVDEKKKCVIAITQFS